jgi:hypothetical protein
MINQIDWGGDTALYGAGPAYLLIDSKEALDLRISGPDPELQKRLKGFDAFLPSGQLKPLIYHLFKIYGGLTFGGIEIHQNYVLSELARIVGKWPRDQAAIDHFASALAAAVQVRYWSNLGGVTIRAEPDKLWFERMDDHVPVSVIDADYGLTGGPGSLLRFYWAECLELKKRLGHKPTNEELLAHIQPVAFVVRTPADSVFAQVATLLVRVPTKKEIREALLVDHQTVGRLCFESGSAGFRLRLWLVALRSSLTRLGLCLS